MPNTTLFNFIQQHSPRELSVYYAEEKLWINTGWNGENDTFVAPMTPQELWDLLHLHAPTAQKVQRANTERKPAINQLSLEELLA